MVLRAYGLMGLWSYGLLILLIEWSYGLMVLCSGGRLIKQQLIGPGRLSVGCTHVADEAHLSGVGNIIRMVMSHFIELKRCPEAKRIAFRKARL